MLSSSMLLIVLFASFIVLFSLGIPLAFSLLFASLIVIGIDPQLVHIIVPLQLYSGMNSFLLLAISGFLFAALMMNKIGITDDIVKISDLLVGNLKGGLAHINVVSSMLTGGVSGSSTADVAGIGSILIPAMNKKGYDRGFSASLTAASSSIGSIIPPEYSNGNLWSYRKYFYWSVVYCRIYSRRTSWFTAVTYLLLLREKT